MGCSNARLLVQAPLTGEPNAGSNNPISSPATVATSPTNVATDTNNTTTRMHLTGVDLVVERNGSYTLLLTPKTHKQLMPYVLRKKRFRILVDKPRSDPTLASNEPIMENNQELKVNTKKDKKSKQNQMESTIESIQQVATEEYEKAKARFIGGRSIDRGDPEDEDVQSDEESMIEEVVTTIEQDKDLECKIKKKIETKRTIAQHPETHDTITKVVKTEVTEITRTITINDHHDLERAKRELGINDVNRLLPSSSLWIDQSRLTHKRYEPFNEIITSKDFSFDTQKKQISSEQKPILAESTTAGRGTVTETLISEQKSIETKKKKKKSKLCSCTRAADDEQEQQKVIIPPIEQPKKQSVTIIPIVKSAIDTQIKSDELISPDIKQLIVDKKFLLIEYIHSKIFSPSQFFSSAEQDVKGRKISSRILDLLRYNRCSSWTQVHEQLTAEYSDYPPAKSFLEPMVNTYKDLLTTKQSNLLDTFATVHNENDLKYINENSDYLNIVQTHINQSKQSIENTEDISQNLRATIQEEQKEIVQEKQKEVIQEVQKEPIQEEQKKAIQEQPKPILAESTTVGRSLVTETLVSEQKPIETKKKKKKSKLCSCTRAADDEQEKQKVIIPPIEQPKKQSVTIIPTVKSAVDTQIKSDELISPDIKQLIIDKKFSLIEYIHSKVFSPSQFFSSAEQDAKGRKISSRILDLLRYNRCSSWTQVHEQLAAEYSDYPPAKSFLEPMVNTYKDLLTTKQSNLLDTFATVHNENDIEHINENSDYLNIVQTYINQSKQSIENTQDISQNLRATIQEEQKETIQEKQKEIVQVEQKEVIQEVQKEPIQEEQKKAIQEQPKPILAESTTVGRGPVTETLVSEQKPVETKKKKKKSKLCSCTRAADDEQEKQRVVIPLTEQPKKQSVTIIPTVKSAIDTQTKGEELISPDIQQLIIDKKFLLIEYIHSKIFSPSQFFLSTEQDAKGRKISSRILDLLRYNRCSSWTQMHEQLTAEYSDYPLAKSFLEPMINTYKNLLTTKQSNLSNTFATIHNENDIKNIHENSDYLNIVQTHINQSKQSVEDISENLKETIQQEETGTILEEETETIQEEKTETIPEEKTETIQEEEKDILQEEQKESIQEEPKDIIQQEQVINDDKLNMTDDIQESTPIYNEEYLIKMLADISQHKPITLAEAIAYQYIDIEDPKLGLSNDTIQCIKHLFRPLSDEKTLNLIRVKRSGEYLTDVNLSETNSFEKLTQTDPLIYQLQQTFEPTLDFNEKQFRSLTETILNNKEQYDQLQFDIARTSLPIYDLKESSTNDFSQSDSGYSMTTATYESLASKIKIEFEPINQDIPIPPKRDDLYEEEKIDLDKATQEQLDKYELNQDLIQIIKSDFDGSDKTIGQAILSRELRLDSTDPSDISNLHSLGIHKEQIRILTAFFFPKYTRIIAYSPEPGRFIEAQTTFNPDYPGYKTDTTIIQIQEKQLSSDHLAMQRNIHDDRTPQKTIQLEEITTVVAVPPPLPSAPPPPASPKDKSPPSPVPVYIKKRKSSSSGGLLSCFKSKKPKPGTEQQGQSTVLATQTSISQKPIQEKTLVDYSILPDGKRIYIDIFRDRPGLDMSYRPNDFENRFVLPVSKPSSEYERPATPETATIPIQSEIIEEEPVLTQSEIIQEEIVPLQSNESTTHLESQIPRIIEHKVHVHLEPRSAIIEPVDVQPEQTPTVVIPLTKSGDTTMIKKSVTIDLHGASVNLPEIELVKPGPLPTLPIQKVKKSTGGLCASCFGKKSADKKKKEKISEPIQPPAPIEQKKSAEKEKELSPIVEVSSVTSSPVDKPSFPQVNIDQFRERNLQKSGQTSPKPEDQLGKVIEPHYQLPSNEPVPPPTKDLSIFSQVNIDTFRERTLHKGSEKIPIPQESLDATNEKVSPVEEPHYQLPINEPVLTTQPVQKDSSTFSQVNIDTFRERTLHKGSEKIPIPQESLDATNEKVSPVEEPHYQLPINEPILTTQPVTKDSSTFSQVNIDTFRERTLVKGSESRPKSQEPHYELPSGEPVPSVSIPLENEYSIPDNNTYDIPRSLQQTSPSIETKTKEKIINHETMIPPTTDIQKSSGDFVPIESIKSEIKESKLKKNSSTLPTKKNKTKESKKKSNLFSTFFRHSERKSKVPALDLPSVERDLSPNNQLRAPHRHGSDPLHIPSTDLPKLDLPLPAYDRPEVNMTTGSIKQTSEFAIPIVDFPPIPNLELPENNKQLINLNSNEMKAPNVELPDLQSTINNQENTKLPEINLKTKTDQTDHKKFPIETDYTIKKDTIITTEIIELLSPTNDQQITIINTHLTQSSKVPSITQKQTTSNLAFQLPSPEPVLTLSKESKSSPPSFDDDVPSPPSKIVPAIKSYEKQSIETKSDIKKKSSPLAICSCFGNKSTISKDKTLKIEAPKSNLPEIDMPVPSSNISSILKTKGSLQAPSNDLPPVDLTPTPTEKVRLPTIYIPEKKQQTDAVVPSNEIKKDSTPSPILEQPIEVIQTKQSPLFEIKAPVMNIPEVDLSGPLKTEAHLSFTKKEESTSIPEQIQSSSDSGLEAIINSHVHPSSTLEDIQQYPSVSSGFGSGSLDNTTIKSSTLPELAVVSKDVYDFTGQINLTDEKRTKLISQQNELKKSLETEISKSLDDFDSKKDHKNLNKILTHGINLIKDKKVTTYSQLKQKLIIEHKNDAFIVEPVVRSLYYTIENHGLDNFDKPEFSLAIHDMVRLPGNQTYDTVTHLNKESASLATKPMTKENLPIETSRSCLTCGRSKSKTKLPISSSSTGLLDERRVLQLNTHKNELGNILRDHIQSSQPPIRKIAEHPKETEKIVRKSLTYLTQPNIISYEQVRNDLKTEYKQTYYLIDPIVDIIRDTFDHCDITQMNEKINLSILDSNISETANLYNNNNQNNLLTIEEYNSLKSNQLSWLKSYLINNELKEKKLTRKQTKELNKILHRNLEILSINFISSWDELLLQLQREYPKAHDLCNRSIELIKQSQKDGLFHLQQAPVQEKRRASSLITDRARQNLKTNRNKIIISLKNFLTKHTKTPSDEQQLDNYLNKIFNYLEEQKVGQFKSYNDLKEQLKKDFHTSNQDKLLEQIVDVVEQAHATNQFDDIDKPEVQTLMKDRLDGKPLIIKEVYVSLPPRVGAYGDDSLRYLSTSINGDQTTTSHRVARGLSWREANERARILFYRGKHPAIHYDEQAAAFDVRMLLETASGGTQEIPVTDSDVQELLNSCGVQWDGVNIVSLVDHSEDVVRAAEQAALKVIREKGLVELREPPTKSDEIINSSS